MIQILRKAAIGAATAAAGYGLIVVVAEVATGPRLAQLQEQIQPDGPPIIFASERASPGAAY